MADFSPCPYCGFQIPELSEVCGHCQREVGWHGGFAYKPEEAAQKWTYTNLIWDGWPWLLHLGLTLALVALTWFSSPETRNGIGQLIFNFIALGVVVAMPIFAFRWIFVRIKYRS